MADDTTQTPQVPHVPLGGLEDVWFQVTGTRCNLRCHHCFISCGPDNRAFGFMSLALVRRTIAQATELGAKAFYFTGGEPFMHPDIAEILTAAMAVRPTTVLTNGMILRDRVLRRLAEARPRAGQGLTFRVSLDGYTAEMNDALRGPGVFDKTLTGIEQLLGYGFEPIITIVRTWSGCDDEVLAGFVTALEARGYQRPRLKVLPCLELGAERHRRGDSVPAERITPRMMAGYDVTQLLCSNSRLVTDRGVWVCPLLLDSPEARMAETLAESLGSYPLRHAACVTCYHHGAICSNSEVCSSVQPADGCRTPASDSTSSADTCTTPSHDQSGCCG